MSIQSIIDNSGSLTIIRRKMVGIQYTKNQLVKINETPTINPWQFEVDSNIMPYDEARTILEELDRLDRTLYETITFGNHPNMKWMFSYRGEFTPTELDTVTLNTFIGNQMVLNVAALNGSTKVLFEKGDFIQLKGYPFPFTVTSTVLRGLNATVTFTVHRPNMLQAVVAAGTKLNYGSDVQFRVICPNMPTYKLLPGATKYVGGVLRNNAYVEFSSAFSLYEYVT